MSPWSRENTHWRNRVKVACVWDYIYQRLCKRLRLNRQPTASSEGQGTTERLSVGVATTAHKLHGEEVEWVAGSQAKTHNWTRSLTARRSAKTRRKNHDWSWRPDVDNELLLGGWVPSLAEKMNSSNVALMLLLVTVAVSSQQTDSNVTCRLKDLPDDLRPDVTFVRDRYDVGDHFRVMCDFGFEKDGDHDVECGPKGRWVSHLKRGRRRSKLPSCIRHNVSTNDYLLLSYWYKHRAGSKKIDGGHSWIANGKQKQYNSKEISW